MKKVRFTAEKTAVLAMLTALSLITFIIENQFPPLFIPGARMGLANIFSFAAVILYSPLEGFIIVAIRTGLGAIFAGNVSSLLYSFTGGMVAVAVTSVLVYVAYPKISVLAISILSAVVHNITQNAVFVLLSNSLLTFGYMPYLILVGVLSGAIVGGIIMLIFKKVPLSVFERTAKKI